MKLLIGVSVLSRNLMGGGLSVRHVVDMIDCPLGNCYNSPFIAIDVMTCVKTKIIINTLYISILT